MRRLILHIGTEKTGTSSIQRFLQRNTRTLVGLGFRSPACLADAAGNHSWLPLLAYNADRVDDLTRRWLDPGRERAAQIEERIARLARELEQGGDAVWIISSEHLQSRLTTPEELMRLRDLLERQFEAIELILYIRQPIATAVSLWSTAVQCGHPFSTLPGPEQPYWHNLCDHATTIRRWRAAFPGTPLQVRLFQRGDLKGGDLIADFSAAAGLPDDRRLMRPSIRNPTLSHRGILMCAHLNRRLPRPDDGRPSRLVSLIAKATAALPAYRASREEERAYEAAFSGSAAWLLAREFPGRSQLWAPAPPPASGRPVRLSRLERAGLDGLAALWKRLAGGGPSG